MVLIPAVLAFLRSYRQMKINNWIKIITLSISFTGIAFFSIASSSAKEYYKWVDSKGSTHYTTTPPPKTAKKKGKVDTYGWRGETTTTPSPTSSSPNPENQQTPAPTGSSIPPTDQQQREANEALQRANPVTDSRSIQAPQWPDVTWIDAIGSFNSFFKHNPHCKIHF